MVSWIAEHWFDLVQTLGIIGGLLFTASALRTDARAKRVQSLFTLTEQHRSIWERLYSRPELARILEPKPDLDKHPVTQDEELFVKFLILHLYSAYRAAQSDVFISAEGIGTDIQAFFSLPIPQQVWEKLKPSQDREFVSYVEDSIARKPTGSKSGGQTETILLPKAFDASN